MHFDYPRPPHHHAYTEAFSGTERFDQTFTGIEFRSEVLDRPHIHRQPELHVLLRTHAQQSLERLTRPQRFVEHVRALGKPGKQMPHMTVAARQLGISVRSLRRRLEEEGASYRALRQSHLEATACAMLRDPSLTIQAIAHDLGFAESAAFHRAFKHWTGMTPAAYRAAHSFSVSSTSSPNGSDT